MSAPALIHMIDSIESPQTTGNPIPQAIMSAPAVAGYLHGNSWPTYQPYADARPDLVKAGRLVSITLSASFPARCLDIESGGAVVSQAPGWFRTLADRSNGKPILYTFASQVGPLINEMTVAGIPRSDYLIWAAHFTFTEHVCAPSVCGFPQADGTQFSDRVAENCDGSVMFDYVFKAVSPPPPPPGVDPMSVTICSRPDGTVVALCETTVKNGQRGEVFALWSTKAANPKDGQPVWHGAPGKLHDWVSLGTPGR